MKKEKFILACALALTLSGCGGSSSSAASTAKPESKAQTAEIGTTGESDNIEYSIVQMDTENEVNSSQASSTLFYTPNDSSKVFLDLILDVKNTGSSEISPDDVFEGTTYTIDGTEFNTSIFTETGGKTNIDRYGQIMANDSTWVHICAEVDEASLPDTVDLNLVINGNKQNSMKLNRDALKPQEVAWNAGEVITKEGSAEITYVSSYLASEVYSETPNQYYSSGYRVKDGSIYAVAKFTVKNIGTSSMDCDDAVYAKAIVDDTYEYTGFVAADKDGSIEPYSSIDPLETVNIYFLAEMPVDASNGTIKFKVAAAGEIRYITMQK
ncbi:MAG: hypothetical protein PUA95_03650 [Lactimicrobium massiliense]|nr:hypothetical protein [Lactimicrobium massiliense]MDD6229810.1 hypothetical protein [Lactimicrobium massiliense]MDD6560874.1 hypothetical protein [Lactimicrobium massiliense]